MRTILFNLILLFAFTISAYGQDTIEIKKRIIGTFHSKDKIYNGLSFGFASTMADDRNVKTNGLRLEIPGIQLGLWNVNQKQKLPIINWNFNE